MADRWGVVADGVRAGAQDCGDVSFGVYQVLSWLCDRRGAEGWPWGGDKSGRLFANGDSGYLGQVDFVGQGIGAKTGLVGGYSTGVRTAADTVEQQDQSYRVGGSAR